MGCFPWATCRSPSGLFVRTLQYPAIQGRMLTQPSSKASRTLENLEAGDIKLSDTDLAEVNEIIGAHTVKGGRYLGKSDQGVFLWG